eukprot:TRINITY_DN2825_c0_g1_i1.p1 TRINITY_DN2825_c0_g1~~TRINITY_DN2825_c0_g1_i1.p1  ORF type:complete len:379 (+),score=56.51 TRINITY_DN2825_c0_g1_i1:154-1290(+)
MAQKLSGEANGRLPKLTKYLVASLCLASVALWLSAPLWYDPSSLAAGVEALSYYEEEPATLDNLDRHPCKDMFLWHKCLFAATHFHPSASQRDDDVNLDDAFLLKTLDKHLTQATEEPFRLYLHTSQLKVFFQRVWPVLLAKETTYVIVTGCSDVSLSKHGDEVHQALANDKLVRWYAQNSDLDDHPKITRLPIGIDFHTLAWRSYKWNTYRTMPQDQNSMLLQLSHQAINQQRDLAILINFKIRGEDERSRAVKSLESRLPASMFVKPGAAPRKQVWEATTQVEFVLSPPGVGMDCHRTWEALALGTIPIVLNEQPFAHVYQGYPVITVDSWDEVTEDALFRWRKELRPRLTAMLRDPVNLQSISWMRAILEGEPLI